MISIGAAIILSAVAPFLASWFNAAELSVYLRLFSIGIPFTALFNIHQSILIAFAIADGKKKNLDDVVDSDAKIHLFGTMAGG